MDHAGIDASKSHQHERDGRRNAPFLRVVDMFQDELGIAALAHRPGVMRDQLELKIDCDALSIKDAGRPQGSKVWN